MADLSGVTTNFLATASETFEDNLSASITAGATIVPVNNASEYVNGDVAVITVDAGTNDEATFVGRKNGNQFEDCVWTEGNVSADHASGAPVVDYDSATHYNLVTKALKGIMEQDGSLKADPIREALNLSTASTAGWEVFPNVLQVSSGYNLGAKIYNLTVPNADATSIASQGMALRYERGTTPPANSLDLESSSSQYATKATPAGISFTDDYTLEALFTLESYTGAEQIIVGRCNGTTEGWSLSVNANGQLVATAQRIAANNRVLTSNRVLPLGEPIHVAVTQDHSGNVHAMYINGESVTFTNTTTGTITAIVQGTSDLRVGALSSAASLYFDGRLQEVRVWNTIRTSTQINDNMGQMLTGSETNLVAYYPFSTNLNDLTANANHLTGSGGAAVSAGNVFKSTGYARIVSVTYSAPNTIIQVYAGDDFIPNMTLNSLFFSTGEAPYGLPQTLQVTSYNLGKRSVKATSIDFETLLLGMITPITVNQGATGMADLIGSDLTITIPAGRKVRFAWSVPLMSLNVSGSRLAVQLNEGTTIYHVWSQVRLFTLGSEIAGETIMTGMSGIHTFKLVFGTEIGPGTTSTNADAIHPVEFYAEIIG